MAEKKKAVNDKSFKSTPGGGQLPSGKGDGARSRRGGGEPIKNAVPSSLQSARFIHQFVPYLLLVLTVFVSACYIFVAADAGGSVGVIGSVLNDILCGLFGWPAYLLPLVLINLAVFWRRYVDMNLVGLKLTFSFIILLTVSSLVHVVTLNGSSAAGFDLPGLWTDGVRLHGGGALGGLLGEMSYRLLGIVGSMIIFIPVTGILLMFLFGTTPRGIWLYIRYKMKIISEHRRKMREEKDAAYAAADNDEEDESALRKGKGGKAETAAPPRGHKLGRREKEGLRRAEKNLKDERRRRREEILSNTSVPADTVFTEGNVPVAHVNHVTAGAESGADAVKTDLSTPDIPLAAADKPEAFPAATIPLTVSPVAEKGGKGKTHTEVITPVRTGGDGKNTDSVVNDNDFINLNNVLNDDYTPQPAGSSPAGSKKDGHDTAASNAVDDLDLGIIVSTEDLSELIESDDDIPTTGKQQTVYVFPPHELLAPDTNPKESDFTEELKDNAKRLMETLSSFNVRIKEINYSRGPTITRYELKPDAGVRVRSIANLVDDIALSLATTGVRIEAPIPGKPAVGVEVPNRTQATVFLRTLIESQTFADTASRLAVCLGEDVAGKPIYFNIDKMPHLLIAGATGMGKSVCINSLIVSILYKAKPDEVKLILVDPKKVEFNVYRDMPHLYVPVVSDPKKAAGVLATAVAEMENRFEMIEKMNVRDITNYNRLAESDPAIEPMPRMVIVIDELADLMMTAPDDVETAICRLAQKARAAGIHLIIGTQRPSVDVITGLIKANIPSRIAFTVASQIDSRTIIDMAGAEKLIGRGDMLFAPVGAAKPMRVQGAFVGELEVEKIVDFIKINNSTASYDDEFIKRIEEEAAKCGAGKKGAGNATANIEDVEGDGADPKLREAIELAIDSGKISTSLMQRRLEVGYGRAAKIIDQMEKLGYVSAADGNKPRRVLITKEQFMEKVINDEVD